MCQCIILHGVPRVMFRDTGTECDQKQEGQGITFVLVVTAVINQGETPDKAGQFHYCHV